MFIGCELCQVRCSNYFIFALNIIEKLYQTNTFTYTITNCQLAINVIMQMDMYRCSKSSVSIAKTKGMFGSCIFSYFLFSKIIFYFLD